MRKLFFNFQILQHTLLLLLPLFTLAYRANTQHLPAPFFASSLSSTSEKFQSSVKWEKNRIYEMLTYARQTTHLNTQTSEKNLFKSQKKNRKKSFMQKSSSSSFHHFSRLRKKFFFLILNNNQKKQL